MAQGRRVCGSIGRLTGAAANKPSSNGVVQPGGNTPVARRKTRRSGRDRGERPRRSRQAKRGRNATVRNARPRRLIPTAVLQKTHKAVRPLFRAGIGLDEFFSKAKQLTAWQRARIVDQATMLLEGFYAHLPLKRAMYAV